MADRRKKYNFKVSSKYLLIAFALACFVLLFVTVRFPSGATNIRSFAANMLTPMQNGINKVGKLIYNRVRNFTDINTLIAENEELKSQLEQLRYDYDMLNKDNNELAEYRALYELDQKYVQYPKVAARIIGRDTNNFYATFTIDKGSAEGMQEGMNVLAGNGLCGIIYEVYDHSAKVRSIIDDSASLSGMFSKSSDTCMVNGNLESMLTDGYIDISMISINADVEENAAIVTSHISDKYHQGILVGYAVNIEMDAGNMSRNAKLIPAVDFEHLEYVLIITEMK